MKKTLSALTIGLLGAWVFFGTENINKPIENNSNTYEIKSANPSGVYFLLPGEEIGQTNDKKFDDYWTEISSKGNTANQLFILKGVKSGVNAEKDKYFLDINYSWNNLTSSSPESQYNLSLDFINDEGTEIGSYKKGTNVDPKSQYGVMEIEPEIPVSQIEAGHKIYMNTTLTENIPGGNVYKNSGSTTPIIDINDYVNGFNISDFVILEDSILPNEFQFNVEITPRNGTTFDPETNILTLYSNKVPLETNLVQVNKSSRAYQYTYKVTNLKDDQVYENWAIGVFGFDNIESVSYRGIRTAKANPNKPAVISGITIGVIVLILLIILIILIALKSRKKVIENSVYNEYRSFLDENGNLVTMTQEEFEKLSYQESKKYQEVENKELLDGYYEFHSNNEDENYYY